MDKVFKHQCDANEWLLSQGFKYDTPGISVKRRLFSKPSVAREYVLLALDKYDMYTDFVCIVDIDEGAISKTRKNFFRRGFCALNETELKIYRKSGLTYKDSPELTFVKHEKQGDHIIFSYFAIRFAHGKLQIVDVTDFYNPIWSKEYYENLQSKSVVWGNGSFNFLHKLKKEHWKLESSEWPEGTLDKFYYSGIKEMDTLKLKRGNYIIEITPGHYSQGNDYFIPKITKIKKED